MNKSLLCIIRLAYVFSKQKITTPTYLHSLCKVSDHICRDPYSLYCSFEALVPLQALTCQEEGKAGKRIKQVLDILWALFDDRLCLVSDLALQSLPLVLLRFRDPLSLQLFEDSSARWKRMVDITQKSLHVGVTVSDKAVIQFLQLIRKTILVPQRTWMFHSDTQWSCVFGDGWLWVYCNGWGTLTGCSC